MNTNKYEFFLDDNFVYILKGGPGTGKSTLMMTIAKHFENLGETVEYFFCANDKNSIDAIRLADRCVVIVDGTPPHPVEPKMPGIDGKIVNLGEYISDDIIKHKNKIIKLKKQNTLEAHFKIEAIYRKYTDFKKIDTLTQKLIEQIEKMC